MKKKETMQAENIKEKKNDLTLIKDTVDFITKSTECQKGKLHNDTSLNSPGRHDSLHGSLPDKR